MDRWKTVGALAPHHGQTPVLASYPGGDTAYDIKSVQERTVDGKTVAVLVMGRDPIALDSKERGR